jgi:hypothetical protein
MDVGLIIVIAIAALALIGLFVLIGRRKSEARTEQRRVEAHEHREEAQMRGARAERTRAEAEERAARARREQALADEQAAAANREQRFARDRHREADELDPDRDATGDRETTDEPDRTSRR